MGNNAAPAGEAFALALICVASHPKLYLLLVPARLTLWKVQLRATRKGIDGHTFELRVGGLFDVCLADDLGALRMAG